MSSAMRQKIYSTSTALLSAFIGAFLIVSCATDSTPVLYVEKTSGYQASHGPFDKNGNYVEKWADNPPKRRYIRSIKNQKVSKPRRQKVAKTTPAPTPPVVAAQKKSTYTPPQKKKTYTKPKPKYTPKPTPRITQVKPISPTVVKPILVKPKRKIYSSHTVQRGETLYRLSIKYGVSVSAIQKANGFSGTNIRSGQTLRIPN